MRKQFIQAANIKSSKLDFVCGVPQGSVLLALIFIIIVNNLCNVSPSIKIRLNIHYSINFQN